MDRVLNLKMDFTKMEGIVFRTICDHEGSLKLVASRGGSVFFRVLSDQLVVTLVDVLFKDFRVDLLIAKEWSSAGKNFLSFFILLGLLACSSVSFPFSREL